MILPVTAIALLGLSSASAQDAARSAQLVQAADEREWVQAVSAAQALGSAEALELVNWSRLRAGDANWWEYVQFMQTRGDWPGLSRMRRVGEARIPAN